MKTAGLAECERVLATRRVWDAEQFGDAMREAGFSHFHIGNARQALYRLERRGRVRRTSRGNFELNELSRD